MLRGGGGLPALRTRTAVLVASLLLTVVGVLPVASLAVFVWLIAGLALLDVMAGRAHARRLRLDPDLAERPARAFWPVSIRRAHAGQIGRAADIDIRPGEVLAIEGVSECVLDLRERTVGNGHPAEGGPSGAGERRSRLADPVLESLRAAYPLGDWHDWCRSTAPGAYPTFDVRTDRGEYCLQVSHPRASAAAVAFQIRLLDHLADQAYPAPRVVLTQAGAPWHQSGGLYVVTERLGGTPYDPSDPGQLEEAARGLVAYHQAVATFPERLRSQSRPVLAGLEKNGPALLAAFADIVGPVLSDDDRARLSRSSSYLWSQFIRVPEALAGVIAGCPRLVTHGSYGPEALRFRAGRLSGVSGYTRAAYDLRAFDLADALWAFAGDDGRIDYQAAGAFLAAYGDAGPLEVEALTLVLRLRRLVAVFEAVTACLDSPLLLLPGEGDGFSGLVDLVEAEADRLRWVDDQEGRLAEALGASRVG